MKYEELVYKMQSDLFNFEELKQQDNFTVQRLGDAVYMGTINKDQKRHGKGVMKYK
jgi:hypothetical protein